MYRQMHSVEEAGYYAWFQASAGGLAMFLPWIRPGDYCTQ